MQDIVAIVVVLACVGYAVRAARRQFTGTGGCGCSGGRTCGSADPGRGLKRTPLIVLGTSDKRSTDEKDPR